MFNKDYIPGVKPTARHQSSNKISFRMGFTCFYELQNNTALWANMNISNKYTDTWWLILCNANSFPAVELTPDIKHSNKVG
jgi:hypothetical protein